MHLLKKLLLKIDLKQVVLCRKQWNAANNNLSIIFHVIKST